MGLNADNVIDLDQLLQEKFTSIFRTGYVKYGNVTMPKRYEELKDEIDNLEVYNDDVWVCSFPKTGTTWSQEMIWLICKQFDYKGAEENLGARFPFLEVSAVFDFRELKKNNEDCEPPVFIDDSLKFLGGVKRPRFIKTHLPWSLLPKQIQNFERRPKIIYVSRNPKDTCISYYHHGRLLEGFSGDFSEFFQLFIAGKVIFGPFWENVLSYWKHKDEPNLHFIKYEDMRKNLKSVIFDVAKFVDTNISDEQLKTLLQHLSFESMKKNPAVNFEPVLDFHRKWHLVKVDGVFMRSGKEESHKAEMTEEQRDIMDKWTWDCIKDSGFVL